jgi:hypothetical protein
LTFSPQFYFDNIPSAVIFHYAGLQILWDETNPAGRKTKNQGNSFQTGLLRPIPFFESIPERNENFKIIDSL